MSLDDLVEMPPAIVPMDFHGYDHFVEFERVWKLKVALVVRRAGAPPFASPAGFTGRLAP